LAVNNSQNLLKCSSIHGQVQFVGTELIYVYQSHGKCTILETVQSCTPVQ